MSIGQLGIWLKIIFVSEFTAMTPGAVRDALRARTEIAILDVRQEGTFAEGHPLFAASFPIGRLESQAYERLPRRSVPIVVYGAGAGNGNGFCRGQAPVAGSREPDPLPLRRTHA